jgi:hypothetical protein
MTNKRFLTGVYFEKTVEKFRMENENFSLEIDFSSI